VKPVNGRFRRSSIHERIHSMIVTWASNVLIQMGSSEGQGYTIAFLQEYSGLPPHSLIPKGVRFTSADDLAIQNWLASTDDRIRALVKEKYLEHNRINKNQSTEILRDAARFLYG